MHHIEWEFLPARDRAAVFLSVYGPLGPWFQFFRRAEGYLDTELTPGPNKPGWFRTIDCWQTSEAYAAFREAFAAEYRALDRACAELTLEEQPLGQTAKNS